MAKLSTNLLTNLTISLDFSVLESEALAVLTYFGLV